MLSGREASVSDYLESEWLVGMTEDERDFLLRLSPLDWLAGPVCNEVLDRSDAGELLHRIFRNRLLLVPLDRRGAAYRMHGLLREALEAEFERVDPAEPPPSLAPTFEHVLTSHWSRPGGPWTSESLDDALIADPDIELRVAAVAGGTAFVVAERIFTDSPGYGTRFRFGLFPAASRVKTSCSSPRIPSRASVSSKESFPWVFSRSASIAP